MPLQLSKSDVRAYLVEIAKKRVTCGYKELAEDIAGKGSYTNGNHDGKYVASIGGEISKDEASQNRPLLSVLIVDQQKGLPGIGFFKLAKYLGLFDGDVENTTDRKNYTKTELSRVYDYWATEIYQADIEEVSQLSHKYSNTEVPEEKERIIKQVERGSIGNKIKSLNGYKCQVCEAMGHNPFAFVKSSGQPYIESHHVNPVSTRAPDVLSARNIITVCANHHRQMHYGNVKLSEDHDDEFIFLIDDMICKVKKIDLESSRT